MNKKSNSNYKIIIKGHLDAKWSEWFTGMNIIHESDGTTTIEGPIVDQSELHGLIKKIRDLGMPLVSVDSSIK